MLATLNTSSGAWRYVSLREAVDVSRFPYVLRVLFENLLRQRELGTGRAGDVEALASWPERAGSHVQIRPARVMMDDTAGLPLLGDLAAMRDAAVRAGRPPESIEPALPVDFIVDHSVIADHTARPDAVELNMALEMARNAERYRFLRWAGQAFEKLRIVPPGRGICHQINLEYLSTVVRTDDGLAYPDTLVGIDSHTPMANGLGVVAWGVSGIEGLSAALGEPVALPLGEVIGVRLAGKLAAGVTATDLVLTMTERLRATGVVGKLVEYCGPGLASLTVPDRATVANMTPEAGATMSYFPIDGETLRYLETTGRPRAHVELVEAYAKAQGLWHEPANTLPRYGALLEVDLASIEPSVSGPRLPHGRMSLAAAPSSFRRRPESSFNASLPISDGDIVIAAITSCTNTSNPALMIGAGLLARNAVRRGLNVKPWVRTSLSPGSRVVADYLREAGLQESLDALGFNLTGFGCMSCVGFSGPLDPSIASAIESGVRGAAVLSGNRNYEGRVHPLVRETFLASPPLVVAYALAGTMKTDLTSEPLGADRDGQPVYLHELWPHARQVEDVMRSAIAPRMFEQSYADLFEGTAVWQSIEVQTGPVFNWQPGSTFIRRPPDFDDLPTEPQSEIAIRGARILAIYGDMVTTEHISPMGVIPRGSPAARYLESLGVAPENFVSYAARRINYDVMVRGTFASPHLKNAVASRETIFDAAERYRRDGVPLVVIAGKSFGAGSSRDWSAKGPRALGVRAVIAESYERIYRANLVAAGVLPLEFESGAREALALDGAESIDVDAFDPANSPAVRAVFTRANGEKVETTLKARLETSSEADSLRHGGLLRRLVSERLRASHDASVTPLPVVREG